MAACERESRASIHACFPANLPAANSTPLSCAICRPASIPAASAASFTRSRTRDLCSRERLKSRSVRPSSATASSLPIFAPWPLGYELLVPEIVRRQRRDHRDERDHVALLIAVDDLKL